MKKNNYDAPALEWIELHDTDIVRTSGSLTDKDVTSNDVYGDEFWGN